MGNFRDKARKEIKKWWNTSMSIHILLNNLEKVMEEEVNELLSKAQTSVQHAYMTEGLLYGVIVTANEKHVTFQMSSMDESKRGCGQIAERNGYRIRSVCGPLIGGLNLPGKILFINGCQCTLDGEKVKFDFETPEEADEWFDNTVAMFEELNKEEELQACGHPKSSIMGEGSTHWCGDCEDCVPVKGFETKW